MTTTDAHTVCRCGHPYGNHAADECWTTARETGHQCHCSWQEPATPPPGSQLPPEPAAGHGDGSTNPQNAPQAVHAVAFNALTRGLAAANRFVSLSERKTITKAVVDAVAPLLIEHGKRHGRQLATDAIQQWADTPPGPWDWAAPHVVDGAIAAARGDQADEPAIARSALTTQAGTCAACNLPYTAGATAGVTADGRHIHEECVDHD